MRSLYTVFSETKVRVEGESAAAGGDASPDHRGDRGAAPGGGPRPDDRRRDRSARGSHAPDRLQQLPRGAGAVRGLPGPLVRAASAAAPGARRRGGSRGGAPVRLVSSDGAQGREG